MTTSCGIARRSLLAAGIAFAAPVRLLAQTPTRPERLAFEVWRNGQHIGSHQLSFAGGERDFRIAIDAQMLIKIGPIPVFRYHHEGVETWRDGRFASLEAQTTSNGAREQVSAVRNASGVVVTTSGGQPLHAPADVNPLTHWNAAVLEGPLFNPQTGKLVRVRVARTADQSAQLANGRTVPATRYTLSGDAEIVDWYDAAQVWTALRGKAPDGSYVEYRRTV